MFTFPQGAALILTCQQPSIAMPEATNVIGRMKRQYLKWEASGDHRSIFLKCYSMMTRNMLDALAAGRFHDREWAGDLLHLFAEYYFVALKRYEADPASAPAAWRYAFDAAQSGKLHVMQHLFLGINAHINYDLVVLNRYRVDLDPVAHGRNGYIDRLSGLIDKQGQIEEGTAATEIGDQDHNCRRPVVQLTVSDVVGKGNAGLAARTRGGSFAVSTIGQRCGAGLRELRLIGSVGQFLR